MTARAGAPWVDRVEAWARRAADRPALVFDRRVWTYGELDRRANRLAHALRRRGVGPESVVGVLLKRSGESILAALAVAKAGGAFLPLDPLDPPRRLALLLEETGARALVTRGDLGAGLASAVARIATLRLDADRRRIERRPDDAPERTLHGANLCYVIATSGSTGRPKGVAIEHRQLAAYVDAVTGRLELEPGARYALVSTLAADLGHTAIFPALASGGELHVLSWTRAADPRGFADYLAARRIDYLKITPSHLAALTPPGAPPAAPRRGLILGGEPSASEWVATILAAAPGCEVFNHYGPTETTVGVLTYRVPAGGPPEAPALPLGPPLPGTRAHLVDRALRPLADGKAGELAVAGPGVGRGYRSRPAATAERFVPDAESGEPGGRLYLTGDLARRAGGGLLAFLGRHDDQVKVRGFRVELGEIEATLRRHRDVVDAAVVPWRANGSVDRLAAYFVAAPARRATVRGRQRYRLPNNLAVAHLNRNETDYLYAEIFERRAYLRHGIELPDGACVFDVGSNIGLFSLFAAQVCRRPRIFAFEPTPAVFEILAANAGLYGLDAELFDHGLADAEGTAELTFFPGFSLLSGRYADPERERRTVKTFIGNEGVPRALGAEADALLAARLAGETFTARLRPLSSVLEERGVERVDLLKINVEKSELDVLRGIRDRDWPRIRQVVLEVDTDAHLAAVTPLLAERGFEVVVEQDPLLAGTELRYVYARRPSAERGRRRPGGNGHRPLPRLDDPLLSAGELRDYLRARLPSYMVPEALVGLEALPVTANGKLDRARLPPPASAVPAATAPPKTALERRLAAAWRRVLGVGRVGVHDNFFDLGGNSIQMIQVYLEVADGLEPRPAVVKLFEHPTIASLADYLARGGAGQGAAEPAVSHRRRAGHRRRALARTRRQRAG